MFRWPQGGRSKSLAWHSRFVMTPGQNDSSPADSWSSHLHSKCWTQWKAASLQYVLRFTELIYSFSSLWKNSHPSKSISNAFSFGQSCSSAPGVETCPLPISILYQYRTYCIAVFMHICLHHPNMDNYLRVGIISYSYVHILYCVR